MSLSSALVLDIFNLPFDVIPLISDQVQDAIPPRFGDQILQVDGVSLAGFSSEKVFLAISYQIPLLNFLRPNVMF